MENESMFHGAHPKLAFLLGVSIGVAAVSTVGFFITLSMLLSDGKTTKTAKAAGNVAGAQVNANTNAAAAAAQPPPTVVPDSYTVPEDAYIRGNADATIKLVEYSDLECPYCKQHHATMKQVAESYGEQVAWAYRHYPLSFHANAQKEAEAAECVGDLGGNDTFWSFIDAIYERTTSNGTGFALTALKPLAEEVGVDGTKFQDCLDSGKYTAKVQTQLQEGASANVQGTPGTIIVNEETGEKSIIEGALPVASVKTMIDAAIAGT